MSISKRSLILLMVNIILPPLLGNNNLFGLNIEMINKFILFLIPILYFGSFFYDCWKYKKIKIDLLFVFLALTALSMIISIIFAINFNFNLVTNFVTFMYILGFIYSIHMYEFTKEDYKKIIISIIAVFLIVSIVGIIHYIFKIDLIDRGIQKYPGALGRIKSTMSIATILDKYLTLNLLIMLYLIYKNAPYKTLLYVISIIGVFALAFTFSRTGIFCFYVIAFIFIIICSFSRKFLNAALILILVVILYLIPGQKYILSSVANYGNNVLNSVYDKFDIKFLNSITNSIANWFIINEENKLQSPTKPLDNNNNNNDDDEPSNNEITKPNTNINRDDSASSRDAYKSVAKAIIKEYPLTGIGIGNYNYIYKNQNINNYLKDDINLNVEYLYPHNLYLHFGAEVGIIGLLMLFATFIVMVLIGFKNKHFLLPVLFFISFCLFNLTESILYMKDIAFWIIIVFALIIKKIVPEKKLCK